MTRSRELIRDEVDVKVHVLNCILEERERQEVLKAQGKFPHSCADNVPPSFCLPILMEEVGEVAREINDHRDKGETLHLLEELIQVAAVAMAWAEGITSRMRGALNDHSHAGKSSAGAPEQPANDISAA
jgi:NTP pyrophosphatase (non-canonical NTP hydrolase)